MAQVVQAWHRKTNVALTWLTYICTVQVPCNFDKKLKSAILKKNGKLKPLTQHQIQIFEIFKVSRTRYSHAALDPKNVFFLILTKLTRI